MALNEEAKIYGLCLVRLTHQIEKAKEASSSRSDKTGRVLLESYNSGDLEDIIDILELYDVQERTFEAVGEKLEELAYTATVLTGEELSFDFSEEGLLGLYLSLPDREAVGLSGRSEE